MNRVIHPRPYSPRQIARSLLSIRDWHALRTHYLAQRDWLQSRRDGRAEAYGAPIPWWSYSCTTFLDQVIPTNSRILELGAGGSTLWWLARGNQVTAVERDKRWAEQVRHQATSASDRLSLRVGDPDNPEVWDNAFGSETFDVIVVDHSGDRPGALRRASSAVAEGGMVILDNADRPEYADAIELVLSEGFSRLDFHGLGPINAFSTTTSLFLRNPSVPIGGRVPQHVTVPN